jgi:hypothetical protein
MVFWKAGLAGRLPQQKCWFADLLTGWLKCLETLPIYYLSEVRQEAGQAWSSDLEKEVRGCLSLVF